MLPLSPPFTTCSSVSWSWSTCLLQDCDWMALLWSGHFSPQKPPLSARLLLRNRTNSVCVCACTYACTRRKMYFKSGLMWWWRLANLKSVGQARGWVLRWKLVLQSWGQSPPETSRFLLLWRPPTDWVWPTHLVENDLHLKAADCRWC